MARQRKFTEDEVDYLVAAQKYIVVIPPIRQDFGGWSIIAAEVRRRDDINPVAGGLEIRARTKNSFPGTPRGLPSCSLIWHGCRIRGIDYEVRHDNPDGKSIRGWHEHIWTDENEDAVVVNARPAVVRPDLRGVFTWGLRKWKINVRQTQGELEV
jgi:hypothetical protein